MCNCGSPNSFEIRDIGKSREKSKILNKWILDNLGRKLLVQDPIYDSYLDIIGYITKNESGNIIRIFSKNIKEILD
jgi:hypothetical protein